jgi:hypothetical protein
MRSRVIFLMVAACLAATGGEGSAQDKPALREMTEFMAKGAFTELDRNLARHRLTLEEVEKAGLDGRPTPVGDVLEVMATYEKLHAQVDEPLEVRGDLRIGLTPNTMGQEAYTACFLAFTYNGLVLSGSGDKLVLVRPEARAALAVPRRRWNKTRILATRLFRLGYLAPDPILRIYRDEIGTGEGNAVIVTKANVVIVTDAASAIEKLGNKIDEEIVAAMGDPAAEGPAGAEGPRYPGLGAIASAECIHFYLMAFARTHGIAMSGAQQRGSATRHYAEGDVWLNEPGYEALRQEYRRVNELIPIAREAVAEGWVDPRPGRTLAPAAQRRLEIRFGLVSPLPGADRVRTTKKAARRKQ